MLSISARVGERLREEEREKSVPDDNNLVEIKFNNNINDKFPWTVSESQQQLAAIPTTLFYYND